MPWQKVYTNRGDRLHDSHQHGDEVMNVEQILVESSNIGTITVSETMGFERQYDYMRAFGLGERTALDFPDETAGILNPWQEWEGTEKYTVAYGQGVASSPIQLISAVNTIANDGMYVAPEAGHGDRRRGRRGARDAGVGDPRGRQPRGRRADAAMMREVVCRGTAKQARVPGLSIAGKTGTGFIAQPDGGYDLADGHQGLLRQLRRVPPGRGPAGHDPRVDRRAAPPTATTASAARRPPRCSASWRRR